MPSNVSLYPDVVRTVETSPISSAVTQITAKRRLHGTTPVSSFRRRRRTRPDDVNLQLSTAQDKTDDDRR